MMTIILVCLVTLMLQVPMNQSSVWCRPRNWPTQCEKDAGGNGRQTNSWLSCHEMHVSCFEFRCLMLITFLGVMIALESQDQNISVYVKDLNMHETASKWVSSQFLVGCTESTKAVARNNVTERPGIVRTADAEEPHTHDPRKIPSCLVLHQRGLLLTLPPHEHDPLAQFTYSPPVLCRVALHLLRSGIWTV